MKLNRLATLKNAVTRKPTYRASFAWAMVLVAVVVVATVEFALYSLPDLAPVTGKLGALLIFVAVIPVIVFAGLYSRRPADSIDQYADFATGIDGQQIDEVALDPSRPELHRLGEALNALSKRFYTQHQEWKRSNESLAQIADLVEESPCIMIAIDHFGDIRYLNARAQQVIGTLGLKENDYAILLPKPMLELVQCCISDQETMTNVEISYNEFTFIWTVKPIAGRSMLLAQATVTVRSHRATAESEPTSLPAESLHDDPPQLVDISKHPAFRKKRKTVLVVDDDPLVQDLMSRFLLREGYDVKCAGGGDEGLALAEQVKPDLITLDIMMPGKNGWIILSALKDNPRLAGIPVIIVSGVGNARFVHAMGADDYLPKPVIWAELAKKVVRLAPLDHASKVAP